MNDLVQEMNDDNVRYVIENQEFSEELRAHDKYVAIILTQSWCHQWHAMRSWLGQPARENTAVFYYVYDRTDLFDQFREFKERQWANDQIPYVRYYRDGRCVNESNYCSEEDFYRNFDA